MADSIDGDGWNRCVLRTGSDGSQDAVSNAVAIDEPGIRLVLFAQDKASGRDGMAAFEEAVKKAKAVPENRLLPATTDFTSGAQRVIGPLKESPGRKTVRVLRTGATHPLRIAEPGPKRHDIGTAGGGNVLPALVDHEPSRASKARPAAASACRGSWPTDG